MPFAICKTDFKKYFCLICTLHIITLLILSSTSTMLHSLVGLAQQ